MGSRSLMGRRLADPALTFEVEANVAADDTSMIDKLKANIKAAIEGDVGSTDGGSLMAFVKQEASDAGVLTPQLQAVPDTVTIVPVIKIETVTKTILVQKRVAAPVDTGKITQSPITRPTSSPTKYPTVKTPKNPVPSESGSSGGGPSTAAIGGGAVGGVLVFMVVGYFCYKQKANSNSGGYLGQRNANRDSASNGDPTKVIQGSEVSKYLEEVQREV